MTLDDKIIQFQRKIKIIILKYCPILFELLYTNTNEYRTKKLVYGTLYGILLGILFFELIIVDLNFTAFTALLLGFLICLLLAIGNAKSSQIRCIELLTLPGFCSKSGRSFLRALILVYVITGPVQNLNYNGREVIRVFTCSAMLTYNLTKTRFELMFKPFKQALLGIKTDANEIKDTLRTINDVSAPIVKELEDDSEMTKIKEENDYIDEKFKDSKRSNEIAEKYKILTNDNLSSIFTKKYFSKVESKCEDQLTRGAAKCRAQFQNVYDKCYDTVSVIAAWLLCWPMKLTFVCNIVEAIGDNKICDPTKNLDQGIGEGYTYLRDTKASLAEDLKNVKLQYEIATIKPPISVRQASDTALAVYHSFHEKRAVVNVVLKLVTSLLAFVFLRIILAAQAYHDNYLRRLDFDNVYITRYFRKIDGRRHYRGQKALLPLKKVETKKIIRPWSIRLLKSEVHELTDATFKLFIEVILVTAFILIDRLFYEVLALIGRHSKVTFTQKGKHDMMVKVTGTGLLAGILRSVIKGFNIKKRIKTVQTNEACLPRPSLLPRIFLYKIYRTFLLLWILLVIEAYSLRLRHAICAYFYPKREKQRILFLYNDMLKRRRGFFKYMRKKVLTAAREERLEENFNFFKVLIIRYPKQFSWLKCFPGARQKCIICQDVEPKKKSKLKHDFERCGNPYCYVIYCSECWFDINEQCLACTPYNEAETSGPDETATDDD